MCVYSMVCDTSVGTGVGDVVRGWRAAGEMTRRGGGMLQRPMAAAGKVCTMSLRARQGSSGNVLRWVR